MINSKNEYFSPTVKNGNKCLLVLKQTLTNYSLLISLYSDKYKQFLQKNDHIMLK